MTANDISQRALERIAAEAQRRRLAVDLLHADANGSDPFGSSTFGLVSAQYASAPRTPDHRTLHNILAAVAPGRTLVVVGHGLAPLDRPVDTHATSPPFDPVAYLGAEDFADALSHPQTGRSRPRRRPRPAGAVSASHHVDDIVLRARRNAA